ncbi:MAG: hypothetical protein Q9195_000238 [Heterodermia aff. obscurata]
MPNTKCCQGMKDSLKKALPCREEYVPLPVGGYGLPAIVRRKFSFPAQLPNISVLSLLPDFNSTQHDHLDDTLDSSDLPQVSSERHPLRVKYSLIRPKETISDAESPISTPRLRRKPGRISRTSLADSIPELEDLGETDSTSHNESISNATTAVSVTPPTEHSTSQTTSPKDQRERRAATEPRNPQQTRFERFLKEGKIAVSIRDQIAWKFKRCVPQMLRTFCVTDLQFPGNPIAVVSKDLLPRRDLSCDEAHYLGEEYPKEASQICVDSRDGRKTYRVILQEDLYSCCGSYERPTHRFIGHIDLTKFVESVRFGEDDMWIWKPLSPDRWLRLAHEYMREDGFPIEDPPIRYEAKKVSKKVRLDSAMEVIGSLYHDCFVLGLSKTSPGLYETTHVSQSVLRLAQQNSSPPDLSDLAGDLARGECFYSDLFWATPKRLYCIPMFGPKLNSWLCFLVDSSLPSVW